MRQTSSEDEILGLEDLRFGAMVSRDFTALEKLVTRLSDSHKTALAQALAHRPPGPPLPPPPMPGPR